MAEGTFILRELKRVGNGDYITDPEGEVFLWWNEPKAYDANGGGRAAPLQPWPMPLKQRSVRTDYPNAIRPTEQALGPAWQPFELKGTWDDRYNFAGYAVKELRRFEALVARGNLVEISFQAQTFHGLITDFEPEYRREWDIGYRFTVSNHGRPDFEAKPLSTTPPISPEGLYDAQAEALEAIQAVDADYTRTNMSTTGFDLLTTIDDAMSDLQAGIKQLGDKLDTRDGVLKPIGTVKRMATQARIIQADALGLTEKMVTARADTELAIKTGLSVLEFEEFTRYLRFQARIIMGQAHQGALELDERQDPPAIRVYRPHKGESLYEISEQFFGTPDSWRLIAEANSLDELELQGNELLIIPERGPG